MKYLIIIALLTGCADKIHAVNKRVNSYQYTPDKVSYMKTPEEFIKDGGGDCEDFANMKYQALLAEGFTGMKFVLPVKGEQHAMLEVDGLILDNMNDKLNRASSVKGYRVNYETMQLIARK